MDNNGVFRADVICFLLVCYKIRSAYRPFYSYNTRYAVKYYQLGAFLASTEAHWSYNWPIIIHALNQDASTGVGGVGKAPVLLSVEFAPYRVQAKTAHQIPYAVNFALLIDSIQLCWY